MAAPVIQCGVQIVLLEDVVYAMPKLAAAGFVADPNSDLEVSMDESNWVDVTPGADGTFFTYAPFIRCHGDDGTVILKSY